MRWTDTMRKKARQRKTKKWRDKFVEKARVDSIRKEEEQILLEKDG